MKALTALLVIFSASFLVVDLCPAQEDAILLQDGTTLIGKVVDSSEESVRFQYETDAGETVATFHASDLDPHSFYNIRSQVLGNDAKAHLALARFALWSGPRCWRLIERNGMRLLPSSTKKKGLLTRRANAMSGRCDFRLIWRPGTRPWPRSIPS